MMRALYKLRYAKRHVSRQSDAEQWKIKPIASTVMELCLPEGIRQAGRQEDRQAVSQLVSRKFH